MPRRNRARARTIERREALLFVAAVLWIIGFASAILGVIALPDNLGIWALAAAGLIMILGVVSDLR